MKRKLTSIIATLAMVFTLMFFTIGADKCGGLNVNGRAARAVGALPSILRVLFPNADSATFGLVDAASSAFTVFAGNQTLSSWQKAEKAWSAARPALQKFNNTSLNRTIAVIDILLTQVSVPPSGTESVQGDERVAVNFDADKVKDLEDAVKALKAEAKK